MAPNQFAVWFYNELSAFERFKDVDQFVNVAIAQVVPKLS